MDTQGVHRIQPLLMLCITVATLLHSNTVSAGQAWSREVRGPQPPDRRFGVIETYQAPDQASAIGAGWTRVTFEWNQIQPTGPDSWVEYPVSDAVLDAELAAGREIVGLLVTAPGWAWDQFGGKNVPSGLYLPPEDPGNLWATFVRQMVARHRLRITHWIIWNEPDIWGSDFQSWGGTVEDFARLMEVAYRVAKEVNPTATIHLPAVTHWWDANYGRELFFERLLDALAQRPDAARNGYFFDAFTLHLYFNADSIYDLSRLYQNILSAHGLSKPLWVVETNAPPSDDQAWPINEPNFKITQQEQAAFMVQGMAMALAANAQRVGVYKMADSESDHVNAEPFGLVRIDGSKRIAFSAFQVTVAHFAGFQEASLLRRDNATIIGIRRNNGWTTVAWARGTAPEVARIPAHAASARLVDWRGNVKTIHPQGGYYNLDLPPSACTHPAAPCLIGGDPWIIVEGGLGFGATAPAPTSPMAMPQTPRSNWTMPATGRDQRIR